VLRFVPRNGRERTKRLDDFSTSVARSNLQTDLTTNGPSHALLLGEVRELWGGSPTFGNVPRRDKIWGSASHGERIFPAATFCALARRNNTELWRVLVKLVCPFASSRRTFAHRHTVHACGMNLFEWAWF
jgi:hypothetical protein